MAIGNVAVDGGAEAGGTGNEPNDETRPAGDGEPEAAPGMRAADANDIESRDEAGENAVETTTVHGTEDDAATASSEQEHE